MGITAPLHHSDDWVTGLSFGNKNNHHHHPRRQSLTSYLSPVIIIADLVSVTGGSFLSCVVTATYIALYVGILGCRRDPTMANALTTDMEADIDDEVMTPTTTDEFGVSKLPQTQQRLTMMSLMVSTIMSPNSDYAFACVHT